MILGSDKSQIEIAPANSGVSVLLVCSETCLVLQFNTFILLYVFSFNLFTDLSLSYIYITPIRHMEVMTT